MFQILNVYPIQCPPLPPQDRAYVAHRAGKPVVLEEYGCCKAYDYRGMRTLVGASLPLSPPLLPPICLLTTYPSPTMATLITVFLALPHHGTCAIW
jgi:hypothetical protein